MTRTATWLMVATLALLRSGSAGADSSGKAEELVVAPVPATVGDGRTAVSVEIERGPSPRDGATVPDVPVVSCDSAAGLAATGDRPAQILMPATETQAALNCRVTMAGAESELKVVAAPPGDGLYAGVNPPHPGTDDDEVVQLRPFIMSGGQSRPVSARVVASAGTVSTGADGTVQLALPKGKAPRAIAIVFEAEGQFGAAFVPVVGRTTLPVVSSTMRAQVEVIVAGTRFGPVRARKRTARVPISVPPGVRVAVVRSTDAKGYVSESVADLKTPRRDRIAALVGAERVAAGSNVDIVVAIAAPNGAPADAETALAVSARLGEAGEPRHLGGGMWTVPYRAPAKSGKDRVRISVKGDRSAGRVVLPVPVRAAEAAAIELEAPEKEFRPNDEVVIVARVTDAAGNRVDPELWEISGPLSPVVEPTDDGARLRIILPEQLPNNGRIPLSIAAGAVRREVVIRADGVRPESAEIHVRGSSRTASLELRVRDSYGNLCRPDSFRLVARGGEIGALTRHDDHYRVDIAAKPDARTAHVEIRAEEHSLTRREIEFEPPPGAYLLGAYVGGGWMSSDDIAGPRVGGGVGLRRGVGPVELGLLVGAEGAFYGDSASLAMPGGPVDIDRTVSLFAVPIALRGRLPLAGRYGVSAGAALVPTRVSVEFGGNQPAIDRYAELVLGWRVLVGGDLRLGPGRVNLGLSYGRADLSDSAISGAFDGFAAQLGYEWWFFEVSPKPGARL